MYKITAPKHLLISVSSFISDVDDALIIAMLVSPTREISFLGWLFSNVNF